MTFPRMFRVKQRFEGPTLHDIPAAVRETIASLHLQDRVKPGQTVAITAGSRGIANIDRITRAVVDELKALGLKPFIVPTMGSHGEATAEGQKRDPRALRDHRGRHGLPHQVQHGGGADRRGEGHAGLL